jgi:hypothetical protein
MAAATFIAIWWLPPEHVVRKQRGANGEKATAEVLRHLEAEGWRVVHNLEKTGGGDVDHLVTGPSGLFLLETKHLSGLIAVESGTLTTRQYDDPDEVFRFKGLQGRLLRDARRISSQVRTEVGDRAWVQAVVVVWGDFQGAVESGRVAYVPGRELEDWLRRRRPVSVELEFVSSWAATSLAE